MLDAIGECEQHTREQGMRESSSTWRLYFRKEFFTPWYEPGADPQATDLTYQQIMRGVSVGEYKCDKVRELKIKTIGYTFRSRSTRETAFVTSCLLFCLLALF